MDNIGELNMEPESPVVGLGPQVQVRTSAKSSSVSKNKLKCKQALCKEEDNRCSDDQKYSLTILPSSNKTSKEANVETALNLDVAPQLQKRLDLKSESGVNGTVNGLIVDIKHMPTMSNGGSDSPSHCDKSEMLNSTGRGSTDDPAPYTDPLTNTPRPTINTEQPSDQNDVEYVSYRSELQMPDIMRLIQKDLSEPYSIYTYRYFIHNWPKLCFLAMDGSECVGAIVCKLDVHRKVVKRGYIAMLAVDEKYRKRKIGSHLVLKAIRAMVADDADEVVLETEITNRPALRLYENLGFVRDKRLFRYYLNGVDALRLKLWLR